MTSRSPVRRLALGALAAGLLAAALPATVPAATTGAVEPVSISLPPGIFTEIPPEIVPGGLRLSYYLTTERSARCDVPGDMTPVSGRPVDCQAPGRSVPQGAADYLASPPGRMPSGRAHRRSYFGIFSADQTPAVGGTATLVAATHGENKNVRRSGLTYPNSIYRGVDAEAPPRGKCLSGPDAAGIYRDCDAGYSTFVGTAVAPVDAASNWGLTMPVDQGPAVWPIGGYSAVGGLFRLSHGVRHPSIVTGGDGYLYMFYYDSGLEPGGVREGFRVARAPVGQRGRGWKTWVQSRGEWIDSLPREQRGPGTRPEALPRRSPAAASTELFPSGSTVMTVARVAGRRGFVAIDQGPVAGQDCRAASGRLEERSATRLRVSPDGVRWSAPVELSGPDFDGCDFFTSSRLTYPRFMNLQGTSTKEVALDDFFLLGTQYGGRVWRVRVKAPELAAQLPVSLGNPIPLPDRPAVSAVPADGG
ncbi:hypothetical protein DSM112329_01170 [Paraconexibacter sp. AEG42_29]|uniref:Secreted protein n=1 Tax=Paraconexibacter sp. AEG42_29 TaxID=2997339 RepID=A0AAU7ARV0_9ACTN